MPASALFRFCSFVCRSSLLICVVIASAVVHAQLPPGSSTPQYRSTYGAEQFSKGPAPTWISPVTPPAVQSSSEPNSMVLADTQLRIDETGETVYYHRVMHANNVAGIKELGQVQLEFNPAYQTLTLHSLQIKRGEQTLDKFDSVTTRFLERELGLEQSMYNGGATLALLVTDVRAGDTLDVTYSIHGANPVFNGTVAESFTWESDWRTQLRRVVLQIPTQRKIDFRFLGASHIADKVKSQERVRDGFRELIFEQRDIAPFRFEASYPAGYQPITWLQVSEYKSWNAVATWAADLFQVPANNGAEYDALVARLKAIADPGKRLAEALDFVQSEIRYTSVAFGENSHRPASPQEVIARRYGDCKDKTLLLVSLYRALGFDAKPVLVGVSAHNGFDAWLPSVSPFDHAIVQLNWQNTIYWLDPTVIQKPRNLATLGKMHGDNDVLVVTPKTSALTRIENWKADPYTVREQVKLDSFDSPATLERITTAGGTYAEYFRNTFVAKAPDQLKNDILNEVQYAYGESEWIGDVKIDDDPEKNLISFVSHFRLAHYGESQDAGWVLRHRPTYVASLLELPEAPKRNGPFALHYPMTTSYAHEVLLPAGVLVTAPEENHVITDAYFKVSQRLKYQGGKVSAEYVYDALQASVPTQDMDAYVNDLRRAQRELHPVFYVERTAVASTNASSELLALKQRAEKGDAKAQLDLGLEYAKGVAVPRDLHESYNWWLQAAQKGNADAQYYLGSLLEAGEGVNRDYSAALSSYRRAAEAGHAKAQYQLSKMFRDGRGTPVNKEEAALWLGKAAEQGNVSAQVDYGLINLKGDGIARDSKKAFDIWMRVVTQNKDAVPPIAENNIGVCYEYGHGVDKDDAQAFTWYRKSAEHGLALGQANLAKMYLLGKGTTRDSVQAYEWFAKGAAGGDDFAQFMLGKMLLHGEGHAKDSHEALGWFLRAAAQGSADAEFGISSLYASGELGSIDEKQMQLWLERAAKHNQAKAQYFLGKMYSSHTGAQHLQWAYEWLSLAEKNGNADATPLLRDVAAKLDATQLAEAQTTTESMRTKIFQPTITNAKLQSGEQPPYPPQARRLAQEGEVILDLIVNPNGSVDSVRVARTSGSNDLDEAARTTAIKYIYTPAQQDGAAVASQSLLKIKFKLTDPVVTPEAL